MLLSSMMYLIELKLVTRGPGDKCGMCHMCDKCDKCHICLTQTPHPDPYNAVHMTWCDISPLFSLFLDVSDLLQVGLG